MRRVPRAARHSCSAPGDILRISDPEGEQVADLIAFGRDEPASWLSSGRTFDYNNTIYLTTGHVLYSNRSLPMFTIVGDTVGRHDFLYTPCSAGDVRAHLRSRRSSPELPREPRPEPRALRDRCRRIPTTFNVFMNVEIAADGELRILPPRSRPETVIELRAEMPLIVGLTACSAEMSNNYRFKPIDYDVIREGV